jgi:hypothetical protein
MKVEDIFQVDVANLGVTICTTNTVGYLNSSGGRGMSWGPCKGKVVASRAR